jgi:hypothetical protein
MGVALEFVRAYRQRFGATLTAAQNEELRGWQTDLERRLGELMWAWARSMGVMLDAADGNIPVAPPTPR